MNVLSIVGARPQFIKAFVVSKALRTAHEEVLVHTGQHYDEQLSDVFFEQLDIPTPDYNLGVGSASHGKQTAEMIIGIEDIIESERPDIVLLYGDTNSTLAGAIVGSKADPLVVHVEAGLRSFNRDMPEEINRVLTDNASDVLFAPSQNAVELLAEEGISSDVYHIGDVMYDAVLEMRSQVGTEALDRFDLEPGEYILSTVHRQANTDDSDRLESIIDALGGAPLPVILPLHPRTEKCLHEHGLWEQAESDLRLVDPVDYPSFICLLNEAERVATDSGGVQKEAFFLDTYCVTLRDETEWRETVEAGWNELVGADGEAIATALNRQWEQPEHKPEPYGDGTAAERLRDVLEEIV
jgi:UDP-GlcNAc3NAcA epimerase